MGPLSCGWRYPVVDYLGKPVVVLDDERRIAWAGEYQSYGARNRREVFGGVFDTNDPDQIGRAWPGYAMWPVSPVDESVAMLSQRRVGMGLKLRAHFATVDVVPAEDRVELVDVTSGWAIWALSVWQGGAVRTPWLSVDGTDVDVRFKTLQPRTTCQTRGSSCSGFSCCGTCNLYGFCQPAGAIPSNYWFAGVHMEGFEYSRHHLDAEPVGMPLGFPGMYYDEEIEKFENWNRHYNPLLGSYLSPEPLLQNPRWVASQLRQGRQVPSYSYALNNPLHYVDRDGLRVELMDAEAFRIAADPRLHSLLRWLDSSPDTYRLYGNVTLAGAAAFGQFFPGEDHERGFTGRRGGTIAVDSSFCGSRGVPAANAAGHEATHGGLMDAYVNPMSSPERGPMPPELIPFLGSADPGGGLPGNPNDRSTPHGRLQRFWWPR